MNVITELIFPCLAAFFSCTGFCIIFNIHRAGIIRASLGGALGWLVYTMIGKTILAAFCASAVIGLYAEIMARVRKCPVTGYLVVALLPLVPGGGIYHTMLYAVSGYTQMFLNTLLYTFGLAAALAVGSMISSSLFRTIHAQTSVKFHR